MSELVQAIREEELRNTGLGNEKARTDAWNYTVLEGHACAMMRQMGVDPSYLQDPENRVRVMKFLANMP